MQLEIHTMRRKGRVRQDVPEGGRIIADQGSQIWVFDGEYWEDELPFYRQEIRDRCAR